MTSGSYGFGTYGTGPYGAGDLSAIAPIAGTFAEVRVRSGDSWTSYAIARRFRELTFDTKYLDTGALGVSLPVNDAAALGVTEGKTVIEVAPNGLSIYDGWYGIDSASGTYIADDELWVTYSGKSLAAWMDEGRVYPSAWPSALPAGFAFSNATAGFIVRTLVARAQERGALLWLDVTGFSGPYTSGGIPWAATVTLNYENGTGLYSVLADLVIRGLVSWRMNGCTLELYNLDEISQTRSTTEALFRKGSTILDQSLNTDATNWASTVLVVGDQNQAFERTSSAKLAAIGRRRELYVAQSGITDGPTLQMVGDRYLSLAHRLTEETVGALDTKILPWQAYQAGDWVNVDTDGTLRLRQVQQIAASAQDENGLKIGLTLGEIIDQHDAKVARLLQSLTNGGGAIPNPVIPADGTFPNPPTGVTITPNAYSDTNGGVFDQITTSWSAPTLNTDGSALVDLGHYELQHQVNSGTWSGIVSIPAGTTVAYSSGYQVGQTITFRVRAVDTTNNASVWATSAGVVMPNLVAGVAVPSAPQVYPIFRGLLVGWNGQSVSGFYPALWARTEVYVSTSSGFTPSAASLAGTFTARGGGIVVQNLVPGTIYYVQLVAYDQANNVSTPSAEVSGVPKLVDGGLDIIASTVTSDVIAANAILAGQIDVGALDATTITALSMTGAVSNSLIDSSDFLVDDSGGQILVYQIDTSAQIVVNLDYATFAGTNGVGAWSVPSLIKNIKLEAWGGGAGGSASINGQSGGSGAGGGGGDYVRINHYPVTAGTSIPFTIGAGGVAGIAVRGSGRGQDGGTTTWNSTDLFAWGGHGGINFSYCYQPGGGALFHVADPGAVKFRGGTGGWGFRMGLADNSTRQSGGGGAAAAGTKNNGKGGSDYNSFPVALGLPAAAPGGVGSNGGGSGGIGSSSNAAGMPGVIPGGGGGGGGWDHVTLRPGGAGAPGRIRITYAGVRVLVASISAVAGTDMDGNDFPAGVMVYPSTTTNWNQVTTPGTFIGIANSQASSPDNTKSWTGEVYGRRSTGNLVQVIHRLSAADNDETWSRQYGNPAFGGAGWQPWHQIGGAQRNWQPCTDTAPYTVIGLAVSLMNGMVTMKGHVDASAFPTTFAQVGMLPVGYAPLNDFMVPISAGSGNDFGSLYIGAGNRSIQICSAVSTSVTTFYAYGSWPVA